MADVERFNLFLLFKQAVYDSINVRLAAVEQMPELVLFSRHRAPVLVFLQGEYRLLQSAKPLQGRAGSNSAREVKLTRYSIL